MPGEFNIKIKLDGDAFEPEPNAEIERILRWLAAAAPYAFMGHGEWSTSLCDINGNRVGEAWCYWRPHEEEETDGEKRS